MPDAIQRQWLLLRSIPRTPQRKSTAELHRELASEGYSVTVRSIQRDLNDLSASWGFTNDVEGRTSFWYWPENFGVLDVPGLSASQALVFFLVREYLTPLLPPSQLDQLTPYFRQADKVLSSEAHRLLRWRQRVRMVQRGPQLRPPDVPREILAASEQALLKSRKLKMMYRARGKKEPKEYVASLHALVVKDGVVYGVATFWDYEDLSQIALHRVASAQVLDEPAKSLAGFDLDHYLREQEAFSYPSGPERIRLRMRMPASMSEHLAERPLSADQKITAVELGLVELQATVASTHELTWWLLGFGDTVEVLQPQSLRRQMKEIAERMVQRYSA